MAKVKVKVLQATIDGKGEGEVISIEKKSADHFVSIGWAERVEADKKEDGGKDSGGDDK